MKHDAVADLVETVTDAMAERVAQRVAELLRESQPKPPPQEARYLNERAAAKRLGLSVRTLQMWRSYGRGPPYRKAGRRVLYEIAALENFLKIGGSASNAGGAPPGKAISRAPRVAASVS